MLGAQTIRRAADSAAPRGLEVGLLAALLAAAALLSLVALPSSAIPHARVASVVVDRRLELALGAAAVMTAGAIVYLVAV